MTVTTMALLGCASAVCLFVAGRLRARPAKQEMAPAQKSLPVQAERHMIVLTDTERGLLQDVVSSVLSGMKDEVLSIGSASVSGDEVYQGLKDVLESVKSKLTIQKT